MPKVLIVAEHDGAKLNPSIAKCVACARGIAAAEITVVVCAADASAVASQAAQLAGVTRVLAIEHAVYTHQLSAVLAPQIVALAGPFTHVLGPSTTFGKDVMPRIAALLDTAMGGACWTLVEDDEDFLTADLRTEFHRSARPGTLRAEGHVVQRNRRVVFCAAELFQDDELVASSRCTQIVRSVS